MKATRCTSAGGAEKPHNPISGREPKALAQKRFSGFKPELEKEVRGKSVVESEMQSQLKKLWGAWKGPTYCESPDFNYYLLLTSSSLFKSVKPTPGDITVFCLSLPALLEEKSFSDDIELKIGLFLSALINHSKAKEFEIPLEHLGVRANSLGFRNRKALIIKGAVGNSLGEEMRGGTIRLFGNCGNEAGSWMKGGRIEITGDSGAELGHRMEGGEIHVAGTIALLSHDISGGKIYNLGRLVYGGDSDGY